MSFEPREYLRHILAEAEYLAATSAGLTRDQFQHDPTLQRAFVRSLEIIGEAAKRVPPDIRSQNRMLNGDRWLECATVSFMTTLASITTCCGTSFRTRSQYF